LTAFYRWATDLSFCRQLIMVNPDNTSRITGSILGVAVVDALGSPVEFQARGTFPEVVDMLDNETFGEPAGSVSVIENMSTPVQDRSWKLLHASDRF
jgi:hypothetical protein